MSQNPMTVFMLCATVVKCCLSDLDYTICVVDVT